MEKYIIETFKEDSIVFGTYTNRVYHKQSVDYGEEAAMRIRDNAKRIFADSRIQFHTKHMSNNVLLVGKVQSGKTSNLEMLTAIAFDNGFNCMVMYGGYDSKLLKQSIDRFKKTFDIDEQNLSDDIPELLSTDNLSSIDAFEEDLLDALIERNKPLIIISMKRKVALLKVNSLIKRLPSRSIKAFIIDDEGDQASLNTELKKANGKQSPTYENIVTMKKLLNSPLYFSVTATPQANVLLGQYSELKPDSLLLIEPGRGYTGSASFHSTEDKIYLIEEKDIDLLSEGSVPLSLKKALNHYLISSAIMKLRNLHYSDMIIHTSRYNSEQKDVFHLISNLISDYKDNIKNGDDDLLIQINDIMSSYNSSMFSETTISEYGHERIKEILPSIIKHTYLILQNSKGEISQAHDKLKFHKIFIGGDLLQRGLTFKNLVTTYFTRWPKKGNMDTVTQRARWLGYRAKFFDLCLIFTTFDIMMEYSHLSEIENDLWDQFYSIQNDELSIDDIVINAEDTKLDPTRSNVVFYDKASFTKKWNNQRIGVFDKNFIKSNNEIIEGIINKLSYSLSKIGRTDEKFSTLYSQISYVEICEMMNNTNITFENDPIKKETIMEAIKKYKIYVQKMFGDNIQQKPIRERSFDENCRISALQQGADTNIIEYQHYLGDSHVIVDENAAILQIFKVRPKLNGQLHPEFDQYMFSLHLPVKKNVFKRSFK